MWVMQVSHPRTAEGGGSQHYISEGEKAMLLNGETKRGHARVGGENRHDQTGYTSLIRSPPSSLQPDLTTHDLLVARSSSP